ncbi:MAG TPA: SpoIIE family protein phosphatase [Flavobacteriales bacterium]|nr:SpoIIE family protein phosphatase [Flavobacteriales bacterium]
MNNYFHSQKERLNKKLTRLIEFEKAVNQAVYYQNLVFLKDFVNAEYYIKSGSYNEKAYFRYYAEALKHLKKSKTKESKKNEQLESYFHHTREELKKIDYYFKKIVYLQKLRGFRDEGMEGRMRAYAHWIEANVKTDKEKSSLLQLRRHEKDYFLRGDTLYAERLRLEANVFASHFDKYNKEMLNNIAAYTTTFDSIKHIDNLTGVKTGHGYNNLLSIYTFQLNGSVTDLYNAYREHHKEMLGKIDSLRTFAFVVLISLGLLISTIIAYSITIRLRRLSDFMNRYVESKFKIRSRFEPDTSKDEIAGLVKNFQVLENEITVQFEKYKIKVAQRTEEILKQKSEIEKQNSVIAEKNEELTRQKNILDFQNHHILDSLKAAKELQKAFFPSETKLKKLIGDYHLKFEPLDIVSGDFYWAEETANGLYIAVGDCTGHGAHGALMSINGISLLNQALRDKELVNPQEILNYLSAQIFQQFRHEDFLRHSIDIAIIRIAEGELHFAGAQRNIFIIQDKKMIELEGDRRPLGWITRNELYVFKGHSVPVKPNDTIIMYTDGLTDQFGGPDKYNLKKFKKTHFAELIRHSAALSSGNIFDLVSESYDSWKDDTNQTDDVSLLIFTLKEVIQKPAMKPMRQLKIQTKQQVV